MLSSKRAMNVYFQTGKWLIAWFPAIASTQRLTLVKPLLVYDEIATLGTEGGYAGLSILANNSAALVLSVCSLLRREWFWFTSTHAYDADEYDDICAMIAQLESDIMTSAVGTVLPWASSDLPGWGLLCDGAVYLKVDYPELWDALGNDWEETETEFFIPDLVNRVVVGSGDEYAMAELGGEKDHAITEDEMPSHQHLSKMRSITPDLHGGEVPLNHAIGAWQWTGTSSVGEDVPMSLMQPYQAMKQVIVSGRFTNHGA